MGFRRFLGASETPEKPGRDLVPKPADPPRSLTELAELQEGHPPSTGERLVSIAKAPAEQPRSPARPEQDAQDLFREIQEEPTPPRTSREPLDPRSWAAEKRARSTGLEGLIDRVF